MMAQGSPAAYQQMQENARLASQQAFAEKQANEITPYQKAMLAHQDQQDHLGILQAVAAKQLQFADATAPGAVKITSPVDGIPDQYVIPGPGVQEDEQNRWLLANADKVAPAQPNEAGSYKIGKAWYKPNESGQIDLGPTYRELGVQGVNGKVMVPAEHAMPLLDIIEKGKQAKAALDNSRQFYRSMLPDLADNPALAKVYEGRIEGAATVADLKAVGEDLTKHLEAQQVTKAKDRYAGAIGKLVNEGLIQPSQVTDLGAIGKAINKSQTLTSDEKTFATAYPAANTTPATTQSNTQVRIEGLGENRIGAYIDTKNNNQIVNLNANEFNARDKAEPGRFVSASAPVTSALSKRSQFQTLEYSIGQARNAVKDLPELDASTRAYLANSMAEGSGAIHTWLQGSVASTMTEKQKEAVRSLEFLAEDALSLRNLMGLGQGSDMVRTAITGLLSSGKSADKSDMLARLDKFEQLVGNLKTGVAAVGPPQPKPASGKKISDFWKAQ
jgi:hypothetical protein